MHAQVAKEPAGVFRIMPRLQEVLVTFTAKFKERFLDLLFVYVSQNHILTGEREFFAVLRGKN